MGLNIKKMAEALQTPYRTYQNWELGTRRIPGILIAAIELMEKKMKTVMIYKVEATKGFYAGETGVNFSLYPCGGNTSVFEGTDDGGCPYILPSGFEVAESEAGPIEIYDNNGSHCILDKNKHNQPMLVFSESGQCRYSNKRKMLMLWLEKAKSA